ncbi:hypothetical protein LCGC14_1458470 [marine sediment metagenome]|uniref:Uncharacterized protein n=1 Tax=marine sediment metagenome TaxID=412755 RepID=A0A0F9LWG4_9ZZZZ
MSTNEQVELLMEQVNDLMIEMQEDEELFQFALVYADDLLAELDKLLDNDS